MLIGDAAGWNDPIIGQGLSITMRDMRVVSEMLKASDDWSAAASAPYVEERRERIVGCASGRLQSRFYNEFGSEATPAPAGVRALRGRPELSIAVISSFVGPELPPPDVFSEDTWHRILD